VVMGYATSGGDKALTNLLGKVSGSTTGTSGETTPAGPNQQQIDNANKAAQGQ